MNVTLPLSIAAAHSAGAGTLLTLALLATPLLAADPPADSPVGSAGSAALVRRDAIRLNVAGANAALHAALRKAEEMQLSVNISVVDDGGHLLTFARMDGARPGSIYTSMTKATTAALIRSETGPLPTSGEVNPHLSLAIENAAAASGGKFTTLKGGVPIVVDGQVVGAVGVGGAKGEEDQVIARAGAAAVAAAPEYRINDSDATPTPTLRSR